MWESIEAFNKASKLIQISKMHCLERSSHSEHFIETLRQTRLSLRILRLADFAEAKELGMRTDPTSKQCI